MVGVLGPGRKPARSRTGAWRRAQRGVASVVAIAITVPGLVVIVALLIQLVNRDEVGETDSDATAPSSTVPASDLAAGMTGIRVVGSDGGVYAIGSATLDGVATSESPVVAMASRLAGGYWMAHSDGMVDALGGAPVLQTTSPTPVTPVVAMAANAPGDGYWLASADGTVYAYGTATVVGSIGSVALAAPIAGLAPSPSGLGYWMVGSDGGVFAFGDAAFYGSAPSKSPAPIVGLVPTSTGAGYWLVGSDGAVAVMGDAAFHGAAPTPLTAPIVALVPTATGAGYWLVAADGGLFAFGDATPLTGLAGTSLTAPIVAASAV